MPLSSPIIWSFFFHIFKCFFFFIEDFVTVPDDAVVELVLQLQIVGLDTGDGQEPVAVAAAFAAFLAKDFLTYFVTSRLVDRIDVSDL